MTERRYLIERVDDAAVVQVYDDGFASLTSDEKRLIWHLYEAALWGRDIYYDQRHRANLAMRDLLEALVRFHHVVAPSVRDEILRYTKLFWINTGAWSHLTGQKNVLRCEAEAFTAAVRAVVDAGASITLPPATSLDAHVKALAPLFFDPAVDPCLTVKNPPDGRDILEASCNNLYSGVRLADLDGFTEQYALNSRLVKQADGTLVEEVYRLDGRYGAAIARIVSSLEQAARIAPPGLQRSLNALIRFYRTGEEADRIAYDIAWTEDKASSIDTINGFIEVYLDARGRKGAWEAVVYHVNDEKTRAIAAIAGHAQWFEDHMPYAPAYRRSQVTGVTATAIDIVVEAGDSGPMSPIGINLPNDDALRQQYGSKSVALANIVEAYEESQLPEFRVEFCWDADEVARAERWGRLAGELTTNLHEVVGHGSGRVNPTRPGTPQEWLRELYSSLEETRADLIALYFLAHPVVVDLGLVDRDDHADLVRAEYEGYARNVLSQLRRIRQGTQIEEDHMRNRQAIVHWLMAETDSIVPRQRDGKSFYVVIDVPAFTEGVARLLADVQRMKSEGDYEAAKAFFDRHGTSFDARLRDEVVARVDALGLPAYTGFVMPTLTPLKDASGDIIDVDMSYPCDLTAQMLDWSARYRTLS